MYRHIIIINSAREIADNQLSPLGTDRIFKLSRNSFIVFSDNYHPVEYRRTLERLVSKDEFMIADVGEAKPISTFRDDGLKQMLIKGQGGHGDISTKANEE